MRHGITRPDRLHTLERRQFVLALRRTGATYQAILEATYRRFGAAWPKGYDRRDAHRDVVHVMRRIQAALDEDALAVRQMELERLDELQLSIWPSARAGNLDAILTILRLMERRARLMNLDAPLKIAQTTPEGTQPAPQATGITEAEWAALLATHQAQHAQATCT